VTAAALPAGSSGSGHGDFQRWRRRSRLIRHLRVILPLAIGAILATLAGFVIRTTIVGVQAAPSAADAPIQLVNPRFVGRDDKGRAYVLTAVSATRDENDYQRVLLDRPSLILDEEGENPTKITAKAGVYREDRRVLNLDGGVKMTGGNLNFDTASSIFNTATGELEGQGQISGVGSLGEITAKSYGVYDKGDRLVFKGGVRGRIDSK
jgi:lipopolysaccharide export system protein LptC